MWVHQIILQISRSLLNRETSNYVMFFFIVWRPDDGVLAERGRVGFVAVKLLGELVSS